MTTLNVDQMCQLYGGRQQDQKAGYVCGVAIGLSIVVGLASGGIGMIAMLGGAAAPACGVAAGSLFYGN